jgi:hypothetical protein
MKNSIGKEFWKEVRLKRLYIMLNHYSYKPKNELENIRIMIDKIKNE